MNHDSNNCGVSLVPVLMKNVRKCAQMEIEKLLAKLRADTTAYFTSMRSTSLKLAESHIEHVKKQNERLFVRMGFISEKRVPTVEEYINQPYGYALFFDESGTAIEEEIKKSFSFIERTNTRIFELANLLIEFEEDVMYISPQDYRLINYAENMTKKSEE